MNKDFANYLHAVKDLTDNTEYVKYKQAFQQYKKIILIGNGGSNSITSHIAQDFVKFSKKIAYSFSDPSMLTCFANDFGVENMFRKFLEYFCDDRTLCIIISSSGESKNILECIAYCENNNIPYGLLTGFSSTNSAVMLAKNTLWSYNIPLKNYGVVECVHQIFLHGVI